MLDKIKNQAEVVGRVYDLGEGFRALQVKTVKNEQSENYGKEFIQGTIHVAVDDEGLSIVPVEYTYVTPTFKSGKVNSTFTVLKSIIENDSTWMSKGKDGAAIVRLTPSIETNDFINREGQLVEAKQLQGGFAELCSLDTYNLKKGATFQAQMVITGAVRHIPEEDNEKEYMTIKACAFNFRKEIQPVELKVYDQRGFAMLEEITPNSPIFSTVTGMVDNRTIKTTQEEPSDWGVPVVKEVTRRIREWVVTNIQFSEDITEDSAVTVADLTTAIQNREIHKADVKRQNEENKARRAAINATPTSAASAAAIPVGGFNF